MPHGFGYNQGGFTTQQHGPVVLSSGQRKQLNLLLEDRHQENCRTYGWPESTSGYSLGMSTQRAMQAASSGGHVPDAADEELNYKVNNKRTPSGNFFQTINTALVEKQSPPNYYHAEDVTQAAAATLKASRSGQLTAGRDVTFRTSAPPSPTAPAVYGYSSPGETAVHQAVLGGGSSQRLAPWTMPWQTGDRATGRRVADQVRNKRTPSGNFAVRSLAKANK